MLELNLSVAEESEVKEEIKQETAVADAEKDKLQEQASQNVEAIFNADIHQADNKLALVGTIESFGMGNIKNSASKNSLLSSSVGKLANSGGDGSLVSNGLMDLKREVTALDPSPLDFTKKGLLGKLTNPIRNYLARYQKADSVIAEIVTSLEKGAKSLTQDNTTLAREEAQMREISKNIAKEIQLAELIDAELEQRIAQAEVDFAGNPDTAEKLKFIREEVQFPLRQRIIDMQTMIAVNYQGIASMQIIQRNNKELIRGVNRATTVTVTALRNAVMVAEALYNQKIVLQKIEAINKTTENMILATSKMLNEQGAAIHQQASSATISPEVLKESFQDVLSALEQVSTFKENALPQMKQTIEVFKELTTEGEKELARLEKSSSAQLIEE